MSTAPLLTAPLLIVPGRGGSGPGHWQSLWTETFSAARVEQRAWDAPVAAEWIATLDAAIAACAAAPVLVAHSLGCTLVAHWAKTRKPGDHPVRAAMLVAPPDVESDTHTPREAHVFRPVPMTPLPFPSLVVASADDRYCDLARARAFAEAWGADFRDIGAKGHINLSAGFGPWPEGERMLEDLLARIA